MLQTEGGERQCQHCQVWRQCAEEFVAPEETINYHQSHNFAEAVDDVEFILKLLIAMGLLGDIDMEATKCLGIQINLFR